MKSNIFLKRMLQCLNLKKIQKIIGFKIFITFITFKPVG